MAPSREGAQVTPSGEGALVAPGGAGAGATGAGGTCAVMVGTLAWVGA